MTTFTEDELVWRHHHISKFTDVRFDVHDDGDIEIEIDTYSGHEYRFIPVATLTDVVETAESWLKAKREYEKQR